ncbi:chorismate synthase [Fusobacterium necrophorum]|uniref:Chorismate synthase n=1 Tax=Fusobacterium necrophorum TaxID=859 RepID=A0A4Q2KTR4_9FUSO|nr:chorismate synthase [Fusobacterium necrophorum]RXZ68914.1 chorismate synthase [Fusobacterium necrophorum]
MSWGKILQLSIFGESHGSTVGITISGLLPGITLPMESIKEDLAKRAPGQKLTSPRKEKDEFEIISGIFHGKTTGAPLTVIFRNTNIQSKDYELHKKIPRPGHADFPAQIKYRGFQDIRGGGHFSGRLTAPLVFAGAIAKKYLQEKKIQITSRLLEKESLEKILPQLIKEGDSIGASISCQVRGLPIGIGTPFFDSLESSIAHLAFSIPGVKGIEFGLGFDFIGKRGSEVNDEYRMEEGKIITTTNYNGGILGGLSNGMPVEFRVVFKPTASIFKVQQSVNLEKQENTELQIRGRHDPCIALRAQIVVEAVAALAILDQIWMGEYYGYIGKI